MMDSSVVIVRWMLPPNLLSVTLATDFCTCIYVNDRAPRRVQARIIKRARRTLRRSRTPDKTT